MGAAKVVIQLGHCYRRSGSTGTEGEQDFVTRAGAHTAELLDAHGHRPLIVLADDPIPTSQVFVALHCDGSWHKTARGASVGHQDPAGQRIAIEWKAAYQRHGWSGGFRRDNYTAALAGYYGVRRARAAGTAHAFIVECGFLTNAEDRALLTAPDRSGYARVAWAITDAVGAVYRHPTPAIADDQEVDVKYIRIKGDKSRRMFVFNGGAELVAVDYGTFKAGGQLLLGREPFEKDVVDLDPSHPIAKLPVRNP